MAKRRASLVNEKYLTDACDSILSNLSRAVKRRQELLIWGPTELSTYGQNYFQRELEEKCDTSLSSSIDSVVDEKMKEKEHCTYAPKFYENCYDEKFCIRTENQSKSNNDKVFTVNRKKRVMSESEKTVNLRKNQTFGIKRTEEVHVDNFVDWCNKRREEFRGKAKTSSNNSVNSSPTYGNINAVVQPSENLSAKRNGILKERMKKLPNKENNNEASATEKGMKRAKNKERLQLNKVKTLLSIKLIDDKDEKVYEYMSDLTHILHVKQKYPKMSAVLPNVDSDKNRINFSIEAVNIVLRFMINQSLKSEFMPPPITGIEVLAATRSWEMHNLYEKFKTIFLQKSLSPSNVSLVFTYANEFNLEEICNACRSIAPYHVNLNSHFFKREKTCYLTISTYIEPLECCFPFTPMEGGFEMSFERRIKNIIRFKAISGCYTVVGFQLQLKDENLVKSINDTTKNDFKVLSIDYNAINKRTSQIIANQREEKYLRPVNIVYFKKGLVVNSGEIGEIVVETDVKPCLCSVSKIEEIKFKESYGEFKVSQHSSFNFRNSSDEKLFFIRKLFYHVKKEKYGL